MNSFFKSMNWLLPMLPNLSFMNLHIPCVQCRTLILRAFLAHPRVEYRLVGWYRPARNATAEHGDAWNEKKFFLLYGLRTQNFSRKLCEFGFALLSQTLIPIFVKISNEICRWICKCSVSLGNNLVNGYQELTGRDELFWKYLKYSSNIFFAMPNRYRTCIYTVPVLALYS